MANDKWPVIISLLQQLNLSDIIGTSFCSNLIMETRVQYVRDGWRSYGPPVLGAILVLVILFGGYSLWSRGRTPKVTPIAIPGGFDNLSQELNNKTDLRLSPTTSAGSGQANIPRSNLGGGTGTVVTPTTSAGSGQAPSAASSSAMAKGGVLPKAGFPGFALVAGLFSSLFAGLKLSKYKK